MARISFKNGVAYMAKINKLSAGCREKVLGPAIYDGAEVVADAVRENLKMVPTSEKWATEEEPKIGPTKAQKKGLYAALGIAPLQEDETGFLNVKVGFDGYNDIKTKRWPNGQPNQMVARAIESGTSFQQPNPFMKGARQKFTYKCKKAMTKRADEEVNKIMGGK